MENTNFKVYIEEKKQDYGCLYIDPLERGYGDTLGNALRRLLLSSIKGVAVTAVRIDGVLHEFSTIPGVREDVIEILMNLKHIPIKAKNEKPQLKAEGYRLVTFDSDDLPKSFFTREENPGVITAKDLPWDNDFEFCGDGVLCTLEPNAHLVMEIYIEPGVGYLSAERERPAHLPVDALLTDAIFSPVKRVNYRIEPARVGQSIDYERLILEVWTNGAISPEDSVKEAAEIAKNYFGHIAKTVNTAPVIQNSEETADVSSSKTISSKTKGESVIDNEVNDEAVSEDLPEATPIHTLELSLRSENCLLRVGIETIPDLLHRSHEDLLKIRNLGKKSLTEIEDKLKERGLVLSDTSMYSDDEVVPEESPESIENEDANEKEAAPKVKKGSKSKSEDELPAAVEKEKTKSSKQSASKTKTKKKADEVKPEASTEEAEKPKKPKKTTKKAPASTKENNDNQ